MTAIPKIQLRNLTKRIGNKTIVDHLTLDIQPGEVFGLLGPNGAGKTTTMRMMVGLINISEGQVVIGGADVRNDFRAAMQQVGAIVENPELYKFLSGYNNLVHFARMSKGVTPQRIHEVVALVGLEHRIHDKVRTYSLGMRQRLGLAVALLHNPSVLILDEPTNGLDPAGIREFRDHLRRLAQLEGLSVVVSSHLLSEMELMCDRVAVIQNGKLVRVDRMRDIVQTEEIRRTRLDAEPVDQAQSVLAALVPDVEVSVVEGQLELKLARDQVPQIVSGLVQAGVRVYGIQAVTKTLEDSFLELTGDGVIV